MTYAEQLKHPMWQKRRLEIMTASNFECSSCGDKDKTLNVHHWYYVKGKKIWDYPDTALACLCEDCHQQEHILDVIMQRVIGMSSNRHRILGYALALENGEEPIEFFTGDSVTGMADFYRISEKALVRFSIEHDDASAKDMEKFASSLFPSADSFIKRAW